MIPPNSVKTTLLTYAQVLAKSVDVVEVEKVLKVRIASRNLDPFLIFTPERQEVHYVRPRSGSKGTVDKGRTPLIGKIAFADEPDTDIFVSIIGPPTVGACTEVSKCQSESSCVLATRRDIHFERMFVLSTPVC